jgi:hypothetical protein
MDQWLERLGFAVQWLSDGARAAMEAAGGVPEQLEDLADQALESDAAGPALGASAAALGATALSWAASRWLRPSEVVWSRAVLAGVIGTLLYDATMVVDQRVLNRKFDTISPLGEALTDDPEMQRWAGLAAHYAAGVGLAVLYARYLHGRLPGPRPLHGAAFGLLDAATLTWGGVYPLVQHAGGDLPIPATYAALAHSPAITAQSVLRHLAYGVGVAMVYGE